MRIDDGEFALVLGANVLARPLREADEEALIGRQAVAIDELEAFNRIFSRLVSQNLTAEIGDVLA